MTDYARPDVLAEALALLAGKPRRIIAGGTDVLAATVRQRLDGPMLDLTAIAALKGITETPAGLRIGACTTWSAIAAADLPPACAALREAATQVGGWQIQNAGTIGGNLCNASPAADGVPPLLCLDAAVELASAGSVRQMPLADFLTGPRRTALRPDEILTAILIPAAALAGRSSFVKLGARSHLVISIAMAAVRIVTEGDRITHAALAVGACSATARRIAAVEVALTGAPMSRAAALIDTAEVAAALDPINDLRATATYRAGAAAEILRRALQTLAASAKGEAA